MSETGDSKKTAVVLFNLGGPDSLGNVKHFLFNLFSDKWILRVPFGIRHIIAFLISRFRSKGAIENYKLIGGKSSLIDETIKQRNALEKDLKTKNFTNFQIFISMRYWNPRAEEVVEELKNYNPDEIILLPLYPQFSSSTTLSSIKEFESYLKKAHITCKVKEICCYFDNENFIKSHVRLIKKSLSKFSEHENIRILFSAHSIPKKYVKNGDPYEWQINKTVEAILQDSEIKKYDTVLCYQSKVGPIEWLAPNTEHEIKKAAMDGINLVVVPIAFVSEHIETLVELDIEYKNIANQYGIKYERVKALGVDNNFINFLADLVLKSSRNDDNTKCFGKELCPKEFGNCICKG